LGAAPPPSLQAEHGSVTCERRQNGNFLWLVLLKHNVLQRCPEL